MSLSQRLKSKWKKNDFHRNHITIIYFIIFQFLAHCAIYSRGVNYWRPCEQFENPGKIVKGHLLVDKCTTRSSTVESNNLNHLLRFMWSGLVQEGFLQLLWIRILLSRKFCQIMRFNTAVLSWYYCSTIVVPW